MYILLHENTVSEIIPDINPIFPGIPIEDRYVPDFVAQLMHMPDDTEVRKNDVYDPETSTFSAPIHPPEPKPTEDVVQPSAPETSEEEI